MSHVAPRVERVAARMGVRELLLGVALPVAAGIAFVIIKSMVVTPLVMNVHFWVFSRDLFVSLPAAKYVAHGAVFQLYEPTAGGGGIGYPYTPGLPILLAPIGWIADRFDLLDSLKYPVARPSLFPIFGPAVALVGILPLVVATGNALRSHLSSARVVAAQWAVAFATGSVTVMYMHPEDAIACAALIGSAHAATRGRGRRAGLLLAAGILFKQWAIIPGVVVLFAVAAEQRVRALVYALGLPALVMMPFVLSAPHETIKALTGAEASLPIGQRQIWTSFVFGNSALASATPLRVAWLVIAFVVALYVRHRPTLPIVLAGVGIVMLARLLCEPTIFAYYLGPIAAFALLCAALQHRPLALRTVCAITMQLWCAYHELPPVLWWPILIVGMSYVYEPLFAALLEEEPADSVQPPLAAIPSVA